MSLANQYFGLTYALSPDWTESSAAASIGQRLLRTRADPAREHFQGQAEAVF